MKTITIEFTGVKPLIMHNGKGADPLDDRKMPDFLQKEWSGLKTFRDAKNSLKNKRGKTDKDLLKLSRVDFYSSLYLNSKNQIIVPSENIQRAIETQAKNLKKGTIAKQAVFIHLDSILEFKNKNKSFKSLYDSHKYITLVKIAQSKTLSTRAIFNQWSFVSKIQYNNSLMDRETLLDILNLGEVYGFMGRRPQFGHYKIKVLK